MDNNNTQNGEKTFTQEQVNQIIGERLAKEKAKLEAEIVEREKAVSSRELKLNAREKIGEMGLPFELLDVLNLDDQEKLDTTLTALKASIEKNKEAYPNITGARPAYPKDANNAKGATDDDLIRQAMKLP